VNNQWTICSQTPASSTIAPELAGWGQPLGERAAHRGVGRHRDL